MGESSTFSFDADKPEIIITNGEGVEMIMPYESDYERELVQALLRFVGLKEIVFRKDDV